MADAAPEYEAEPPAISTPPDGSSVAVCHARAAFIDGAAENSDVPSKISAVESDVVPASPPATRTEPDTSSVAVWK